MMYFCFKEEGAGCSFLFLCHVLCYKCEIVSLVFRAEFTVICVSLKDVASNHSYCFFDDFALWDLVLLVYRMRLCHKYH